MKFILVSTLLFSIGIAQLAPANLCLCNIFHYISNTLLQQVDLCCIEDSCPCHEGEESKPFSSKENKSSHSCPFEQTCAVSDNAGTKKLANYETGEELVFHESCANPQILSKQKGSLPNPTSSLTSVPLYLRLKSILI